MTTDTRPMIAAEAVADLATIFYDDSAWRRGDPCFDVRFDAQALPAGSVPCGMLVESQPLVLRAPYLQNDAQRADLAHALACAEIALGRL